MQVIEINDYRENPHMSGWAICGACRFEWSCVAPTGVYELECPECGCMKGHFKYVTDQRKNIEWKCNCGCNVFYIVRDSNCKPFAQCLNCAELQDGIG